MAVEAPIAPGQPAEQTPTNSATVDAASKGDFSAFLDGHTSAKQGKPLPRVAADTPTAAPVEGVEPPATGTPPLSRKQREAQAADDRIRTRVEEATKTLREENDRLKAQIRPATPQVEAPRPIPPGPRTLDQVIAQPDVYKALLTEAQFFEAYPDAPYSAYPRYAVAYDTAHRAASEQARQHRETLLTAQKGQIDTFVRQLKAANEADPTFKDSLSDLVKTKLKPFSALARDASGQLTEEAGPINVIGEQVYRSEMVEQMLRYFSKHQEDLDRLTTVPAHLATLPQALQQVEHITWMLREYGKLEGRIGAAAEPTTEPRKPEAPSSITKHPAPPPTISRSSSSSDPIKSALDRGDFAAFERADLANRVARRRGMVA